MDAPRKYYKGKERKGGGEVYYSHDFVVEDFFNV